MAKKETMPKKASAGDMVAKKDFEIKQGDFHRVIKKGDNLNELPKKYLANMKTEKVL